MTTAQELRNACDNIRCEDYIGTAGTQEEVDALEREHNEMLARIDAEIAHYRWQEK